MRLWGDHGQHSIGQTDVALLGSSALATEVLKCLVLAGIRSYTVFDDAFVKENDLGNNFFMEASDVGKLRAEVVSRCLNVSLFC